MERQQELPSVCSIGDVFPSRGRCVDGGAEPESRLCLEILSGPCVGLHGVIVSWGALWSFLGWELGCGDGAMGRQGRGGSVSLLCWGRMWSCRYGARHVDAFRLEVAGRQLETEVVKEQPPNLVPPLQRLSEDLVEPIFQAEKEVGGEIWLESCLGMDQSAKNFCLID